MPIGLEKREDCPSEPFQFPTWETACAVRAAFLDHLKATHMPETFPGLSHERPAQADAQFKLIVNEFDVDPSKRVDGDMIPCAACGTRKKFRRGGLAWYPDEGVLRVIGNECGDPKRREEAKAEYKRHQELKFLNNILLELLPRVDEILVLSNDLRALAHHVQLLSKQLQSQGRPFGQIVLSALKEGNGILHVMIAAREVDGRTYYEPSPFYAPKGADFLRAKYKPVQTLDEAIRRLRAGGRGDPENSFAWQHQYSEDIEELDRCYANLKVGINKLNDTISQLYAAYEFFLEENLRGIDRWAAESGALIRVQSASLSTAFVIPLKFGSARKTVVLKPNRALIAQAENLRTISPTGEFSP